MNTRISFEAYGYTGSGAGHRGNQLNLSHVIMAISAILLLGMLEGEVFWLKAIEAVATHENATATSHTEFPTARDHAPEPHRFVQASRAPAVQNSRFARWRGRSTDRRVPALNTRTAAWGALVCWDGLRRQPAFVRRRRVARVSARPVGPVTLSS